MRKRMKMLREWQKNKESKMNSSPAKTVKFDFSDVRNEEKINLDLQQEITEANESSDSSQSAGEEGEDKEDFDQDDEKSTSQLRSGKEDAKLEITQVPIAHPRKLKSFRHGHTSQRKSTIGRQNIKLKKLRTFKSVLKAKVVRPKTTNEKKINAEGQTWFYYLFSN